MVGIGGVSKLAKAPVWFAGNGTLVKVPKFSHTFVTRLVGNHGTDEPSALMEVSSGGRGGGGLAEWFDQGCGVKRLFTS